MSGQVLLCPTLSETCSCALLEAKNCSADGEQRGFATGSLGLINSAPNIGCGVSFSAPLR